MTDPAVQAAAGDRAAQLREQLRPHLDALRAGYTKAWAATKPENREERERLWLMVQAANDLDAHLGRIAANGRVARKLLDAGS